MKRVVVAVVLTALAVSGVAFAKNYEVNKKAGEFDVTMTIDKNPPVVGDNTVAVSLKDSKGANITDAKVVIDYSMPAMPGMPAMNYKASTQLKDGAYKAMVNLSMDGAWNFAVKISHGSQAATAKFNVTAH